MLLIVRRFLSLRFTHTFQQLFRRFRSCTSRMPSIPDRWLDYKPVGKAIERTRFIPFKVPLKQLLHDSNRLPVHDSFTPSNLFEVLATKNLQLGLLIDLTFTKRYYNSEEITSYGVKYLKVFCAGKQIPNSSVVNRFTEVVNQFEKDNADNDLLIGVHCTHGVNRTGYLICRYMIDHLQFTPAEALKAYEKARGYPVERTNYIQDLQTRPRDGKEAQEERFSRKKRKKNRTRTKKNEQHIQTTKRREPVVSTLTVECNQQIFGNTDKSMRQHSICYFFTQDNSNLCSEESLVSESGCLLSKNLYESESKPLGIQVSNDFILEPNEKNTNNVDYNANKGIMETEVSGIIVKYEGNFCFIRRHDNGLTVYGHQDSVAVENIRRCFKLEDIVLFDVLEDERGQVAVNILIGMPSC